MNKKIKKFNKEYKKLQKQLDLIYVGLIMNEENGSEEAIKSFDELRTNVTFFFFNGRHWQFKTNNITRKELPACVEEYIGCIEKEISRLKDYAKSEAYLEIHKLLNSYVKKVEKIFKKK